jgi:hypothetical protein
MAPYYDVNGDGFCSPNDVLRIINFLNDESSAEGESGWRGVTERFLDLVLDFVILEPDKPNRHPRRRGVPGSAGAMDEGKYR